MRPAGLGRSRAQSWNCESGVRWEVHVDTGGQPAAQDWVVGCHAA